MIDSSMINRVAEIVSPVFQVGGSIRNQLMGLEAKDYDFSTPLTPDEVSDRIKAKGRRCYDIGKRFGTVGFTIDGQMIEITTFRHERYGDSRKPEVTFTTDLYEDLSRRDFTMNAMAFSEEGVLFDPFNGRQDIADRLIRAVGNAKDRFGEDPLRMLRAARFASQFDFVIDTVTEHAMREMSSRILSVSKERWVAELDKLLTGRNVHAGLVPLKRSHLLLMMLPEVEGRFGKDAVNAVLSSPPNENDRWLALLKQAPRTYYVDIPEFNREVVSRLCTTLKFSNERRNYILNNL